MNLETVNCFDNGFWEAYHRLIAQAKSNQSLSEVQAVAIAKDQTMQYLSKPGANLPTKFDYVAADTSIQLRLEPLHLEYRLYHYKTTRRVNILVSYASIGALWQHEQGVKVISQGGEERWQGVNGLYEIILPQQMVGYADLCRFLNDIATYNYQQKESRIK